MRKLIPSKTNLLSNTLVPLPGSKSETNRALVINFLCAQPGIIRNISTAHDSKIMQDLLSTDSGYYDAQDAGTVMRFMTALLSATKDKAVITGTSTMKRRPIGILVDALNKLGAKITFLEEQGYPPLEIGGLISQKTNTLEIAGNVSSQYISALLMIAPTLPNGLKLKLKGEAVSTPYIDMTLSIMQHFGVKTAFSNGTYEVKAQVYEYAPFTVESDWSSASYWYAIFVLSDLEELRLSGLKKQSLQGDQIVASLMQNFGVKTSYDEGNVILHKQATNLPGQLDFINCPDLAQTFAVLCALLDHSCTFLGLQTLKIKETDRIQALKTELKKIGANFIEDENEWHLQPILSFDYQPLTTISINTYNDHRMAMAFAAAATKYKIEINDAEVVDKSYPGFWQDMSSVGFEVR